MSTNTVSPAIKAATINPPEKLSKHNQALGGTIVLITRDALVVANQKDLPTIDAVPNLNTHLSNARTHANNWLNKYQKDVLDAFQHLIGFNNKFSSFYKQLQTLAKDIDKGNNLAMFKKGLQLLKEDIETIKQEMDSTQQELITYRTNLSADYANFKSDVAAAETKLGQILVTKSTYCFTYTGSVTDLNQRTPSAALKAAFAANGYALPADAWLKMQIKDQWPVFYDDQSKAYLIVNENGVLKVYIGIVGEMAQLNAEMDSDQEAIRKDDQMIAGGAVMIVTGVLLITVGVLGEVESGGATTALIAGGVGFAGGGGTMIGFAAKDLAKKQADYEQANAKFTADKAVVKAVPIVEKQVGHLLSAILDAEGYVEQINTGWNELDNQFQTLHDALGEVSPADGSWISSELVTVKKDWLSLACQAEKMLCKLQNYQPINMVKEKQSPYADTAQVKAVAKQYANICQGKSFPACQALQAMNHAS